MPARIVIGYDDRKFSVFADELTTFLMNCEAMGLRTVKEMESTLEEISAAVSSAKGGKVNHEKHLALLNEISLLLRGMIYEGV